MAGYLVKMRVVSACGWKWGDSKKRAKTGDSERMERCSVYLL